MENSRHDAEWGGPPPPLPSEANQDFPVTIRLEFWEWEWKQKQVWELALPGYYYPQDVVDLLKRQGKLNPDRNYRFLDWERAGRWSLPICQLSSRCLCLREEPAALEPPPGILYGCPAARGMGEMPHIRRVKVISYE